MMVKPGITTLDNCVDSRYTLVTMAAKRARMIGRAQHDGLIDSRKAKPVTAAVDEIASGKVGYVRSEAIHRAQEWETEKLAAIEHMTEAAEHANDSAWEIEDNGEIWNDEENREDIAADTEEPDGEDIGGETEEPDGEDIGGETEEQLV